ncbi:MAG: class I SAM-dependent methyltransferase [Planctomycetes bacterium]|nr:class I SAM-dependent methyltransferase [Planctomycetota bacterium]
MGRLFHAVYDPVMAPLDRVGLARLRREVLRAARGRTLEVGIGTGRNLPYYAGLKSLCGLDPAMEVLKKARKRRPAGAFPVQFLLGRGEAMPFQDAAFDAVVATLVLCTVQDPALVLREMSRVLKPGGRVYLIEHVRWPHGLGAWTQDRLAPLWGHLFAGCRLNQDTRQLLLDSPLHLVHEESHWKGLLFHWIAH